MRRRTIVTGQNENKYANNSTDVSNKNYDHTLKSRLPAPGNSVGYVNRFVAIKNTIRLHFGAAITLHIPIRALQQTMVNVIRWQKQ